MSDFIGDISSIGQVNTTSKSKSDPLSLEMEGFLQMMIAQFQNQDPENAASTTDMLNQMVQMSMVQAITNITDAVTLNYAASLVGKEVTIGSYDSEGKLRELVGTVTGTGTYNGNPVVFVDGVSYSMSSIMAVGRLPDYKTETPKTEDSPAITDPVDTEGPGKTDPPSTEDPDGSESQTPAATDPES